MNRVTKLLLAFTCVVCLSSVADPLPPLSESAVTLQVIKDIFNNAFIKAEIDKDGDLRISDGGLKCFVKIDPEKKLITLFSVWGLKENATELNKLRLINNLNDDLIFVRFVVASPTTLWCDYQFLYTDGIAPSTIVNNYRLFTIVSMGAVATRDPDDLVE
jgi:hypothetical protein